MFTLLENYQLEGKLNIAELRSGTSVNKQNNFEICHELRLEIFKERPFF